MERSKLRNLMLLNKNFLAELYKSPNPSITKKTLSFASNLQLRIVIHILHCLSKGWIPLKRQQFDSLHKAKKTRYLNDQFLKKTSVNKLLRSERKDQLEVLFKFSSCFQNLFYSIFNKTISNHNKSGAVKGLESVDEVTNDVVEDAST